MFNLYPAILVKVLFSSYSLTFKKKMYTQLFLRKCCLPRPPSLPQHFKSVLRYLGEGVVFLVFFDVFNLYSVILAKVLSPLVLLLPFNVYNLYPAILVKMLSSSSSFSPSTFFCSPLRFLICTQLHWWRCCIRLSPSLHQHFNSLPSYIGESVVYLVLLLPFNVSNLYLAILA